MRKKNCVPMIALCLLLSGCGGEKKIEAEDLRQLYRDAALCTMEAVVRCDQEGLAWEGTLKCDYVPEGESTVEVLAPEIIAGVRVLVSAEEFALSYEGQTMNIIPLSAEEISPADCLPRMLHLEPGSLSPLGLWFDTERQIHLAFDRDVQREGRIAFHPCDNSATVLFRQEDFWHAVVPALAHDPIFI